MPHSVGPRHPAAAEALQLAQRGAALTQAPTASVLDVLAAALAAAGELEQAVATAREALDLAIEAQDLKAERQIRARLALYEQRRALRIPP